MANDSMRSGPRGATPQASWMAPQVIKLEVEDNTADGGSPRNFDSSAGGAGVWRPPPGTTWRLVSVTAHITEVFGAAGSALDVGTSADANAFVAAFVIPNTTAAGVMLPILQNGVGFGLHTGNFAITSTQPLTALSASSSSGTGAFVLECWVEPVAGPAPFFTD